MKRKCSTTSNIKGKKDKLRVRRQVEAVERALEHEKNSAMVFTGCASKGRRAHARGADRGVLAAAMMAYIGSGDFELTANKCTSSFVSVFDDLWSRQDKQERARLCFRPQQRA